MFYKQDGLTKVLDERIVELEELQAEYDKVNRNLDPVAKSDRLEELAMKIELVLSMLLKVQRNLLMDLDNPSSYMFRSDIERTIQQVKDYIKSYQGMSFAISEVLRSVRLKIENLYELQKLSMDNKR
jgi:hypothetical protein